MPHHAKDGNPGEGRRWALLRTARGLEQQELALGARVGAGAVSAYEQDSRTPEPATRERLLEALRCSDWDMKRAGSFLRGLPGDDAAPGSRGAEGRGQAGEGLAWSWKAWRALASRGEPPRSRRRGTRRRAGIWAS